MTLSKTFSKLSLSNLSNLPRRLVTLAAVAMMIAAMGGSWTRSATAAPQAVTSPAQVSKVAAPAHGSEGGGAAGDDAPAKKTNHKQISGKINLNTATPDQLMLLPTVGPSKADRIVAWRTKNGGFKRTADLRHVKGFGYKTFKKLEPYIDVKGDTTIAAN